MKLEKGEREAEVLTVKGGDYWRVFTDGREDRAQPRRGERSAT